MTGRCLAGVSAVKGAVDGVPVDGGTVTVWRIGVVWASIGCSTGKLASSFILGSIAVVLTRQKTFVFVVVRWGCLGCYGRGSAVFSGLGVFHDNYNGDNFTKGDCGGESDGRSVERKV